jgi:hypothetical protein
MPFIGQQPLTGAYSKLDAITTSATATYNLLLNGGAYSPASANHLLVSLNGVIQAPQDSFTVSGSTITFASALTSSDNIDFIMALGDVLSIGTPSDGAVTAAKISSGAVTTAKIAANAVTTAKITNANITQAKLASGVAGNGPAFHAHPSTGQSISASTMTKVNLGTERFDTDGKFDTSTSRFTPTVAGIYSVHASVTYTNANFTQTGAILSIYKNGSSYAAFNAIVGGFEARHGINGSAMVQLDADDYIEMYIYGPARTVSHNSNETHFSAAMVRSA